MTTKKAVKMCLKCNTEFPANEEYFFKNNSKKDKLAWCCKKCSNLSITKWRNENKKTAFDIGKKYRLKKLGFTPELFNQMLEVQKNVCALCGTDRPGGPRNIWSADHDHKTGKARGLLCMSCNTTLGHIEGKPADWMDKAKDYIKQGGFYQPVDKP